MFSARVLPPVILQFGQGGRGADRFRGLQRFGPFAPIPGGARPRIAFVFPSGHRDHANTLYFALRNGMRYFRGVEDTFRYVIDKDSVIPVTQFHINPAASSRDNARVYADAVSRWLDRTTSLPDLAIVIHPRTPRWQEDTPYYECKALLLSRGVPTQDVTIELVEDKRQLEWSAANIALGVFVKLGGVPWLVQGDGPDDSLVIGIGRAGLFDAERRRSARAIAFTVCFSTRGAFRFLSLARVARNASEYSKLLGEVVSESLKKALDSGPVRSLTLHVPDQLRRDDLNVIRGIATSFKGGTPVSVVKVVDEEHLFAVDDSPTGVPARGTVIRVGDREYLLYTEGREEIQNWRFRLPAVQHLTVLEPSPSDVFAADLVAEVQDMSQVNWRGFNATSRPISIYYGNLIANILGHMPPALVDHLYDSSIRQLLERRLWFL